MLVFTDEWVQQLQHRYRQHPEYTRPRIYFIATSDEARDVREEIEAMVAALPESVRKDLISRLRKDVSYVETYNELIVGNALRQLGYQVEYSKNIDGLTPDWYAYAKEGVPPFVVEVFSVRLIPESQEEQRRLSWLYYYLHQIPIAATLEIHVGGEHSLLLEPRLSAALEIDKGQSPSLPEPRLSKAIADQVHDWLIKTNPSVGATLPLSGLTFTRLKTLHNTSHVVCIGPGAGCIVDTTRLRKSISEKLHRYKQVMTQRELPFVVAVVADTLTGLTVDNFLDVLLGQEVVKLALDKITGVPLDQQWGREEDGIMTTSSANSSLSVGLWVRPMARNQSYLQALYNANAAHPLPQHTFIYEQGTIAHIHVPD